MKPYQQLPITECGEPIVPIPLEMFAIASPHPYQKLGAPYGSASPYCLRQRVLDALLQAQSHLQQNYPDWRIQIFDAYRPVAVQQFMVDYTFAEVVRTQGLTLEDLTLEQQQTIWQQVYQVWAVPSQDPATPPPHSTGAVVDITLVDDQGQAVFMGSPIDEISPRSHPDYFALIAKNLRVEPFERDRANLANQHRQLLRDVMLSSGFQRHPTEWWHFSLGDQMWAWLMNQQDSSRSTLTQPLGTRIARYGRVE
jgi:D-alanyl-D-alanine dipeptidase